MCIFAMFCRNPMLLFFPRQPGKILQARQNFASPTFCLGSRERFGAEQNQIPEFPHAYSALKVKPGKSSRHFFHSDPPRILSFRLPEPSSDSKCKQL
jgi:hypothetical protein